MKVLMLTDYGHWRKGQVVIAHDHVALALVRNAEPLAVPASLSDLERAAKQGLGYRNLQHWARALDIPATGDTEELRNAIAEAIR